MALDIPYFPLNYIYTYEYYSLFGLNYYHKVLFTVFLMLKRCSSVYNESNVSNIKLYVARTIL
jgi:hypothetical protein